MSSTIRAFVAIELPDHVRQVLAELIERMSRADVRGLRAVRPEGIHLTLKFLGPTDTAQVEPVVAAIERVCQTHRAFDLVLGGPGAFPSPTSPRVLWTGVESPGSELIALQRDVEASLVGLGFPRDERRFSPHLTLARFREGTPVEDRRKAAEALFSTDVQPGTRMSVDGLNLIKSTLLPAGAVYERLARVEFQAPDF